MSRRFKNQYGKIELKKQGGGRDLKKKPILSWDRDTIERRELSGEF